MKITLILIVIGLLITIAATRVATADGGSFTVTSPAVVDGGRLPKDFTGDGASATLPLEWTGIPKGTQSFALIMHHIAPDQTKWYWILYDIPATATGLPRNVRGVGTLGSNTVNDRCEYAPPHSKGPGDKTYIYTVYALSSPIRLDVEPAAVGRDVLLSAMKDKILASAQLHVVYARDVPPRESGPNNMPGGRPDAKGARPERPGGPPR
jgi:Raf kinase inhibitor-like YbhB/YbcL family protein